MPTVSCPLPFPAGPWTEGPWARGPLARDDGQPGVLPGRWLTVGDIEKILEAASLETDASKGRGSVEAGVAAAWLSCVMLGSLIWAAGALVLELLAFLVLVVAVAVAATGTGLGWAWWTPIVRAVTRGRVSGALPPAPGWLFTIGIVVASPAVSYLTMGWVAIWAFGGRAWLDLLAVITPITYVGTVGVAIALVLSWWTCFRTFRRAWPRWIPLVVVLVGVWLVARNLAWTETSRIGWFQPMSYAHVLTCVLALAWAVSLGLASPRRLGPQA